MDNNASNLNNLQPQPVHSGQYVYNPVTTKVPQAKRSGFGKILGVSCALLILIFICGTCAFSMLMMVSPDTTSSISLSDTRLSVQERKVGSYGETTSLTKSKITIIDVSGVISYYTPNIEYIPSDANNLSINGQLKKAASDNSVKAVVLRFNSPGGAVSAAEPICTEIKNTIKKKPVYAFIDTEGASLGYLLPNCTEYIYTRPDSITGSIGVIVSIADFTGIINNLGGRTQTITNTAGKEKSGDGLFKEGSEEYKRLQSMLDETYDYFLQTVWAGRKDKGKLTYDQLKSVADGRIFSGKQAVKLGLVDEEATYEKMIESVINKNESKFEVSEIEVVEYYSPTDPFLTLFGAVRAVSKNITSEGSVKEQKTELLYISQY